MEKSKQAKPEPPKKPLNPYMIYRANVYDEFKKKYPDKKITEIAKLIGESYSKLDGKEKEKIEKQVDKQKQQYEKELADYKKKYGEPPKRSRSPKESLKQQKEQKQKKQKPKEEKKGKTDKGQDKKKK